MVAWLNNFCKNLGIRGAHDPGHTPVTPHHPDLLWSKSQQLPEDVFRHLQTIYGDHFPIEARHHLAGKTSILILVTIP